MKTIEQTFLSTQNRKEKPHYEKLENSEFVEISKKVGDTYLQFVNNLAGRGEFNAANLINLPKDNCAAVKQYIEIATHSIPEVKQEVLRRDIKPEDIIGQFFSEADDGKELLESGDCILEEPTAGIYIFNLNAEDFDQLNPGAHAFFSEGYKLKIPVIILRYLKNEKYQDYLTKRRKEDIPHEINHLIWYLLRKNDVFNCNEVDDEIKKAFLMFQEELTSKLVSNGGLIAYSHLSRMSPNKHAEFEKENSVKMKEIYSLVSSLNTLLLEQIEPIFHKQTVYKKSDLIFAVSESRNFSELMMVMEKWLSILKIEAQKSV